MRDLVHDARMILTREFQRHVGGLSVVAVDARGFGSYRQQSPRLQRAQFGQHCVDGIIGKLHQNDAGELARQLGQMAAVPVPTVTGNDPGDGIDQPGSVVADECDHHRCHAGERSGVRHSSRPRSRNTRHHAWV